MIPGFSKYKSLSISSKVGVIIFFILILGDYISYSLSSSSGISSIPFGIIAYLVTFLSMISFLQLKIISISSSKGLMQITFFFVIFILSALLRVIFDTKSEPFDMFLIIKYLLLFISGILIGLSLFDMNYKIIFGTTYLLMVTVLLMLMDFNNLQFSLLSNDETNYLRIAEWFAFCSLGVISYSKKSVFSTLVFIFSLIALFFINSRFALAAFLIIGLIIIVYRFKGRGAGTLIFIVLISFLTLLLLLNIDFGIFRDSRVLRLFLSPDTDTSLMARRQMNNLGIEAIKNNWFIGDFRGQVDQGGFGAYMHNFLSYWRQYGIVVFLLFVLLLVAIWLNVFKWLRQDALHNSAYLFAFAYLSFATLGVLFSKSYVYTEIFLAIGICTSLIYKYPIREGIKRESEIKYTESSN